MPNIFKKLLSLQFVQIFDPNFWSKKSCKFAGHTVSPNSCTKFNSSTAWVITSCWTEWNVSLSTFSLMSGYFTLTFQMMPSRPVDTDFILIFWRKLRFLFQEQHYITLFSVKSFLNRFAESISLCMWHNDQIPIHDLKKSLVNFNKCFGFANYCYTTNQTGTVAVASSYH